MNLLLSLGQTVFDWTWRASIDAALLILLVFAAQKLLGKSLSPRWRYALGLLILVRLLLPVVPASPLSWENFVPSRVKLSHSAAAVSPIDTVSVPSLADSRATDFSSFAVRPAQKSVTLPGVLCLVWISGCCGLMALAAWRYLKWNRWTKAGEIVSEPGIIALLDAARNLMGVKQPVTMLVVSQASGPAIFGIWSARLLIPRNFLDRLNDAELRLVLSHEMAHVRRKDGLLNILLMAAQFLHWFNPLAWLALHRIRADRELVCDEMVMRRTTPEDHAGYGRLLLKLINEFPAGRRRFLPGPAVVGNQHEIKRRIVMIKNHGKYGMVGCGLAIVVMVALSFATFTRAQSTPTSSTPSSNAANDLIGSWVLVGKPGEVVKPPASGGRIKFFTGTHWCITQADPKNGVVIFHHGGTYSIKGDEMYVTLEYANESTSYMIGHTSKFKIKVEGDTYTQIGLDNPFTEVWQRLK